MIFNHLPPLIYILMCFVLSAFFIYTMISRFKKDRKGLIIFYLILALESISLAIIKILEQKRYMYIKYFDYIVVTLIIIMFIELFYLSATNKGSNESKNKCIIGWILIIVALLLGGVGYLIL